MPHANIFLDGRIVEKSTLLIFYPRQDGWNGREEEEKSQWTFEGSLFYSIICLTTIGYGNQTPQTLGGRFII